MSKDDNPIITEPRLRFPEFRELAAWKPTRLSEAMDFQNGFPFLSKYFTDEPVGPRIIRNRDLRFDDRISYYTERYDALFLVQDGDVLVGMDGDFTPIVWQKGEALLNQRVGRVRAKGDNNLTFLRYFLAGHLKKIEVNTGRTTVKHLSNRQVESIHEPMPTPVEQRRIAECLGSLDDLIAAETDALAALRRHKTGLMQQLFPRPGETLPRLRFPEFRDAGEWDEKPLAQIAKNLNNKRVPITGSDRQPGSTPYYGASGIVDYVEGYLFDEDLLCVSEDGANLLARTYPIAFSIAGKTWVNNHAHVLRFKSQYTQVVVEEYLNSIDLKDFITGMAQPKLNRANLDIIPIPLPVDLAEQRLIADCVTSLDSRISAQDDKLATLRRHKRGLMQQLFPAPDTTGGGG